MTRDEFAQRVATQLVRDALFPQAGLALLAVSGGADSVAMLFLLHDLAPELGLDLAVAHVDHGISSASAGWAAGVAALAEELGLPLHRAELYLGPDASETRARQARYRALRRLQRETGARYLVTAHHADDQVETVVYRLLRGSGPTGLAGIAPVGWHGLVRPLLPFRRSELRAWLAARAPGAPVVTDPANDSAQHDRSWLRGTLLPVARERFPDVDARVLHAASQARRDREAWRHVLVALPDFDFRTIPGGIEVARAFVARYDEALSVALLRAAALEAGCRLGNRRLARLVTFVRDGASGRAMELGGGWMAELAFDRLRLSRSRPRAAPARRVGIGDQGECVWGRWRIAWRAEPAGTLARSDAVTWITPGASSVRAWHAGDRVRPLGGVGRRKVGRLLMEARVPRSERSTYPLVVRDDDILWIPGICRSQAGLPRPGEPALRLDARRIGHPEADGRTGDRGDHL